MKASLLRILLAPLLILFAAASFAVDMSSPPANDKLSAARAKIAAKDFPGAVEELKRVNDPANADWNNLMGYSLRKAGAANAAESERYYNEALRIDPKHKRAHEYLGEAYLMVGNLPKAKEHLAQLDKICYFGCSEYSDLKKAIGAYESKVAVKQ
jgi:Flp pilus assembly protein TadD